MGKQLLGMWGVTTVGSCYFTLVNSESITCQMRMKNTDIKKGHDDE